MSEDHIPQATTTTWDSPVLLCSCGWDSENPKDAKIGWRGHLPDSLDAAWAEAEAALPEGWSLRLGYDPTITDLPAEADAAQYGWPVAYGDSLHVDAVSPAAALHALTAKLRERAT